MGAFGEKLRKQREQRGIALEAISNTTKISTRMLRALEDEQFDQLPGGVFNKGFVRAYARQIGLDEEETVTDYLAALRESQVQSQQILPDFRNPGTKLSAVAVPDARYQGRPGDVASNLAVKNGNRASNEDGPALNRRKGDRRKHAAENLPGNHTDKEKQGDFSPLPSFITLTENSAEPLAELPVETSTSSRFTRNILAAMVLLLTIGLAAWNAYRHRESAPKPAVASHSSGAPESAQTVATALPAAPGFIRKANPKPSSTIAAAAPTKLAAQTKSSAVMKAASATPFVASSATKLPVNSSAGNSLAAKTSTIASPVPPVVPLTLLVRAEETTWVLITADGKPVAQETLIAPAHTSVRAGHEIVVKAGNAAGVSFLLNGKEIPPAGNEGEVKTYIFDANGARSIPQAQNPAINR